MHAVVVGGGLAGLTAAIDLVDAGWQVTLMERRTFPGGRAFSFTNPDGDTLDNGQHVVLACCTAYIDLVRKLGQASQLFLQPQLDVQIVDADAGPAHLQSRRLPTPLHLLPSFLAFPYLRWREKLAALRVLARIGLGDLPDSVTFADWLQAHGQTENAIRRFWDLIVIPTCNAPSSRVSARQAGFVYREGLLRTNWGANIGYARAGLSRIVPEPAVEYLRAHGADIRCGTAVVQLQHDGPTTRSGFSPAGGGEGSVRALASSVITSTDERLAADVFVLAIPPPGLDALLPSNWTAPDLAWAPIVGVNLWYDRSIFQGDMLAAIVDGEAMWLFNRTAILGQSGPQQHVAVSISAAEAVMDVPRAELASAVAAKIARALPAAGQARVLRSTVEKVRAATFVPAPGSALRRPSAVTPLANTFLAGSWTATGWPDTMESAVRSGHTAARLAQDFRMQSARSIA